MFLFLRSLLHSADFLDDEVRDPWATTWAVCSMIDIIFIINYKIWDVSPNVRKLLFFVCVLLLQKGKIESQQPNARTDCQLSSTGLLGDWRSFNIVQSMFQLRKNVTSIVKNKVFCKDQLSKPKFFVKDKSHFAW